MTNRMECNIGEFDKESPEQSPVICDGCDTKTTSYFEEDETVLCDSCC